MSELKRVLLLPLPLLLLMFVVSCSSTAPAPVPDPAAGSYAATRFLLTRPPADAVDYLAAGTAFDVSIDAAGITSGRFYVPASLTGEAALEASLTGRVQRDPAGQLTFVFRPADLFVEGLRFRPVGSTLVVDTLTADGTRVGLTLSRLSARASTSPSP